MSQHLDSIKDSSRRLLHESNLSYPVRKLASAVLHGADLISQHELEKRFALPQFERALFHLCHVIDRPLCGDCICSGTRSDEAQKCAAIALPASNLPN